MFRILFVLFVGVFACSSVAQGQCWVPDLQPCLGNAVACEAGGCYVDLTTAYEEEGVTWYLLDCKSNGADHTGIRVLAKMTIATEQS